MKITSVAQNKGITGNTYPILKANSEGIVVFFTEAGKGVVMNSGAGSLAGPGPSVGSFGAFLEEAYTPFIGTVAIEQAP